MKNVEKWEAQVNLASLGKNVPERALDKMSLWWDVSQSSMKEAQRKYWTAILGNPERYGDVLEEARQKMAALEESARKARERYEYLLSLKEET